MRVVIDGANLPDLGGKLGVDRDLRRAAARCQRQQKRNRILV
jgi:hypothetical protein